MISFKSSLPTIPLYVLDTYIVIGKMIRQATLSLNLATRDKKGAVATPIGECPQLMQTAINILENHRVYSSKLADKVLRTTIKTLYCPTVKGVK